MAFPQTAAPTETIFATNALSHLVLMPPVVNAGDLLLCFFANDGAATVTTPADWTQLWSTPASTTGRLSGYAKVADGSEDGTTVDFETSAIEAASAQVYRVTNWQGTLAGVEDGTPSVDTTTNPDPPSLTPSWDALDTLWFAICGTFSVSVTAAPADYTNLEEAQSLTGSAGSTVASARRELNAVSDDPGIFTAVIANWVAQTVAIQPATVSDPAITDVSPTTVQDGTEIVVTGTTFEAAQGTGKVELGDNATYASATLVEATVSAWADTEITANVVQGALAAGSVWVFITNDTGDVSVGFEITLEEPAPPAPSIVISGGSNQSIGVRLERIYAAVSGHQAPSGNRNEIWLLGKIGSERGINLTSGYKSQADHLIRLYENLTGNTYTGPRSEEMILRAIESEL